MTRLSRTVDGRQKTFVSLYLSPSGAIINVLYGDSIAGIARPTIEEAAAFLASHVGKKAYFNKRDQGEAIAELDKIAAAKVPLWDVDTDCLACDDGQMIVEYGELQKGNPETGHWTLKCKNCGTIYGTYADLQEVADLAAQDLFNGLGRV